MCPPNVGPADRSSLESETEALEVEREKLLANIRSFVEKATVRPYSREEAALKARELNLTAVRPAPLREEAERLRGRIRAFRTKLRLCASRWALRYLRYPQVKALCEILGSLRLGDPHFDETSLSEFQEVGRLLKDLELEAGKVYKTLIGRNIDRLKNECGWSFDMLANRTGLDKKLVLGHVNEGKGAQPRTLKTYADAFSRELKRTVTVAELQG